MILSENRLPLFGIMLMAARINLNADMGEGFGAYAIGDDDALMGLVASANIACGFHGGDPTIMRRLVMLAKAKAIEIGAHPGFDDLWGFGRRRIAMRASDLENLVAYQIAALQGLAAAYGGTEIVHVKPHGALYNMAASHADYANAIASAIHAVDSRLIFVGLPASRMEAAAESKGLRFAREGFCDRLYRADGSLMPREAASAIIRDPVRAGAQALSLVTEGLVTPDEGPAISLAVDTLCIHGDEPGASAIAQAVREALAMADIEIAPLASMA
jgi:UPF0271 protein